MRRAVAGLLLVIAGLVAVPTLAHAQTTVPSNWALTPSGLSAGDSFRLIFATSTNVNATSSNIGEYNTVVQGRAAAGHSAIQTYSSGFRVVGCTASVDLRDNTSTTYTATDKGVPIYWLGGNKVADDYEDFYDGSWDDEANSLDESGNDRNLSSTATNFPFTGCNHDGTGARFNADSRTLGSTANVRVGRPNSSASGHGPIGSSNGTGPTNSRPLYGLSSVFQVPGDNTTSNDATLSALALTDSDSNTVTLSPMFAATTDTYTASVATAVDQVTVSPTLSDSNATVEYLDADNATLTDADSAAGFQAGLSVGDNVIRVKVTAEDAVTTQTYQVTVNRPGGSSNVCTAPDLGGRTEVWSATLTVGELTAGGLNQGYGYSNNVNLSGGALSDTSFELDSTTVTITDLHSP